MAEQTGIAAEERFAAVAADWAKLRGHRGAPSEQRFGEVRAEAHGLVSEGRWTSGPSDLLSVLGRQNDELTHSRMLAWLLTPTGRHGLGRRYLRAFLELAWPGEQLCESGLVSVGLEEVAQGVSDTTGETLESRADIVIHADAVTVVIENKVWAGEQPRQCERLYWSWIHQPTDARFLFLTPSGRPTTTTESDAASEGWHVVSYAQALGALEAVLAASDHPSAAAGRATANQYLATLRGHTALVGRAR